MLALSLRDQFLLEVTIVLIDRPALDETYRQLGTLLSAPSVNGYPGGEDLVSPHFF
jgi:hypothetical protein